MFTDQIKGKTIILRIADAEDAEFTLKIRQDTTNTVHIPALYVDYNQQLKWLDEQKNSNDSYFFVITRLTGERIGTFSLYNIVGDIGETGRMIIRGNQLETLEACILFHDFAFEIAKMNRLYSEIESDNYAAIGLANKVGAKEVDRFINSKNNASMVRMEATRDDYYLKRNKLVTLIDRFAERK